MAILPGRERRDEEGTKKDEKGRQSEGKKPATAPSENGLTLNEMYRRLEEDRKRKKETLDNTPEPQRISWTSQDNEIVLQRHDFFLLQGHRKPVMTILNISRVYTHPANRDQIGPNKKRGAPSVLSERARSAIDNLTLDVLRSCAIGHGMTLKDSVHRVRQIVINLGEGKTLVDENLSTRGKQPGKIKDLRLFVREIVKIHGGSFRKATRSTKRLPGNSREGFSSEFFHASGLFGEEVWSDG
eukprot:jgi/Picsp_1/4873/NSC_02238-R1_---NA---